jgi:tetratricopeptide (TPR) repeat protein
MKPLTRILTLVLLVACSADDPPPADPGVPGDADPRPALPEGPQAFSFLGDTLYPPDQPDEVREGNLARLAEAEAALEANPRDVEALIWLGRRTAYLGRYREAIDVYTRALSVHPDEPRLYRHRGHRYISVRELDRAVADLERAAELTHGQADEVEPDGIPNALGIPTSTLQFNIWYHLGLAWYLQGDFEAAADAYEQCAAVSEHPDSKVATAYWRTMTLRRLGREEEARAVLAEITPDLEVIESTGYLDLLLLHKGERSVLDILGPDGGDATLESATAGYGVGAWHLIQGDRDEAYRIFRRVLQGRSQWAAFGFLAAEAELARWSGR